ncbi:MAG TPA: metallophosphoesterase [Polyangiaceae bacterium]|jgi:predicted phosphodiesterase
MKSFSLLGSADHHWKRLGSRFAECQRIHAWTVEQTRLRAPDVFVSAGDLYEENSTPADREATADWVTAITETCPFVIAKGNHDRDLDLAYLRRLRTKFPVHVVESCGIVHIGPAAIAVVAWPNRSSLAAMLPGANAEQLDDATGDALRNVLSMLGAELAAHDGPRVLVGHFQIDGAVTSVGQPLIGGGMRLGLADLALARADIALCGHIHRPQAWTHGGTEIVMCGSPFRTAFGEVEEKSIVSARWEHWDGEVTEPGGCRWALEGWDRLPTPSTPMLLLSGRWEGDGRGLVLDDETAACVAGAEVRFRYQVASDQQAIARAEAAKLREAWLVAGAVRVEVEKEVVPVVRARAPEVSRVATLPEQLDIHWASRGITLDPTRRARLHQKLGELG